ALFELIADLMCPAVRTGERAVALKSLQETLYMCTEVAPDLSPSQVGKRLESYLELSGSRGLIRVFLSVHLSNLILMDLHDSLQASTPEIFRTRMGAIERLCETAANLLVRSWAKWPKLTQSSIVSSAQLSNDLTAAAVASLQTRSIASIRPRKSSGADLRKESCKSRRIRLDRCVLKKT